MCHAHIKCFLSIVCLILLHLYEILLLFSDEENEVQMTTSHFSTINQDLSLDSLSPGLML